MKRANSKREKDRDSDGKGLKTEIERDRDMKWERMETRKRAEGVPKEQRDTKARNTYKLNIFHWS